MNRLIIALAALALAPAALAEEAAPAQPDVAAAVQQTDGKVDALTEQLAEYKGYVDALRKLKLSGYIQARYAYLEPNAEGTKNAVYSETPGSGPNRDNFYIRRGRLKAVYDATQTQYTVQIDVIPSGISMKEGYASIKLPAGWWVDGGLQLFPFGYEVASRSSADLDLLERARISRTFLNGEYDLGVSLRGAAGPVALRLGVFNGNGIDGPASADKGRDNDPFKDVIGRATIDFGNVTAGLSGWYGKSRDYSRADHRKFDRTRLGADVQVYLDLLPIGGTALKAEYLWGRNVIGGGSTNGGAGGNLPSGTAPLPTGSGWYGIVTQNVGPWNQLAARYESYIGNHTLDVSGATNARVKQNTEVQLALHTFLGSGGKVTVAWFHPMNGKKGDAAPKDPKADSFIVQAQTKF